jgi:hypothetical protein
MEYLVQLQSRSTWLATGVSLWFLVRLWLAGELAEKHQIMFGVWFVAAFVMQLLARSSALWIAGVIAQSSLAVTLILKDRIDNVY